MTAAAPKMRPAVRRCLTLAARSADVGDHARARSFFVLALDLATPEEGSTVLRAAHHLLGGLAPEALVAGPDAAPAAPAGEPVDAAPPAEAPAARADAPSPVTAAAFPAAAPAPPAAAPPARPAAAAPPRRAPAGKSTAKSAAKPAAPPAAARRSPARKRGAVSAASSFLVPALGSLVLGAIVWGAVAMFSPERVDFRQVEADIARGRTADALEVLDAIADPDARVSLLRGRALLARGDTAAARRALTTAASAAGEGGDLGEAGAGAQRILERLDTR